MLKYILLGFLQYGSMTGYDLKSRMDESTMHFWHAHHSQIYSTLRRLDDKGLVTSEMTDADGREKRLYTLTAAGHAALDAWLAQPMTEPTASKEDLLVRVFFSARRDPDAVLMELRLQRQQHQQKLNHYEQYSVPELDGEQEDDGLHESDFWHATLQFGRRYEQMYIAWLDEVIAHIADAAS